MFLVVACALVFAMTGPLALAGEAPAKDRAEQPHGHRPPGSAASSFNVTVPTHPYDVILARPENNSVTLSVLFYDDAEGFVAYGTRAEACATRTPVRKFKKGVPAEIVLAPLEPDTRYYYRLQSAASGGRPATVSPVSTFHTARPAGGSFTFTMTADAHLDEHTSGEVYRQTLANIQSDRPDFHIDLGNLFMTDKHASRDEAAAQYLAQRYYLGRIGPDVPVFLALGTHDGESGRDNDGSADSLAVWSHRLRTRYFPNPVPDTFYSGNTTRDAAVGLLQNYYAWQWGDALFVVLDPFRYSVRQAGGGDGWGWTLGASQYRWLDQTLERSRARFKFVVIHNLLVGNQAARGGVEVAGLNEWGGRNADGSEGFKAERPGWTAPVHQLLVRHRVAAVFKAHDNFYARQQLDGILYLMVPQPSFAGNDRIRDLENYGYKQGTFVGNSGHVRVLVSPEKAVVEYVRASMEKPVADTWTLLPGATGVARPE